tara:strand:- start:138 stop:962 length:825 start_codon:yes stop_codon:yes gene_type:complete
MRKTKISRFFDEIQVHSVLFAVVSTFILSSCSSDVQKDAAHIVYNQAKEAKENGDCYTALRYLEDVDARFPFSAYKEQVQLDLMYCYYRMQKQAQAEVAAERFLKFNPRHKNVDYVLYISGLNQSQSLHTLTESLFNVDPAEKEISVAVKAFGYFKRLVQEHPKSEYAVDARLRLTWLKSFMARHHLAIAQYYFEREAYVAASSRAQYIVEHYTGTEAMKKALELMYTSYGRLGEVRLQEHTAEVYKATYGRLPENLQAQQVYSVELGSAKVAI